jgi:hypothetical protein
MDGWRNWPVRTCVRAYVRECVRNVATVAVCVRYACMPEERCIVPPLDAVLYGGSVQLCGFLCVFLAGLLYLWGS